MNKTGTQTIETQRLMLRRFRIEDADDMFNNWASDPEVTRFLTWPPHPGVEVTRSLLAEWISDYEDGGYFNWVMEYKETGKVIGNISVVKLYEDIEAADIGYCMSRAYWGQGLMSEALRRVMDYLFDVVGLNRVAACHDVDNPGSGRVMDKAGMTQEGILRQAGKNNLGIHDVVWHGAIRGDLSKSPDGLSYIIRKMRADETALLKDFLYEAIFIPEGIEAPARDIVEKPELRVYTDDFGAHPGDNCLVAEADGRVVGAVWTRIMNDYGHMDDETPSFAISLYSEYRGRGIGTQLMVGMLDLLGSQGYERASLAVQKANYAVRMYKNVGFKTVDENDEEYIMVWERHTSGNDDHPDRC